MLPDVASPFKQWAVLECSALRPHHQAALCAALYVRAMPSWGLPADSFASVSRGGVAGSRPMTHSPPTWTREALTAQGGPQDATEMPNGAFLLSQ